MKTSHEIQQEARQLEAVALAHRDTHRRETNSAPSGARWVLFDFATLSSPRFTTVDAVAEPQAGPASHRIEAADVDGELRYYLVHERLCPPDLANDADLLPSAEWESERLDNLLAAGYEVIEADRLTAALDPLVARYENLASPDSRRLISEEIETLIGANELSPTVRWRAKAEVVAFLDGRLDRDALITRIVRFCRDCGETQPNSLRACHGERLLIDQP